MKRMLLVGIAAVGLLSAIPAHAALTMSGETGVGFVPTADVVAPMNLAVAVDYADTIGEATIPVRLEVGAVQGLEVGGNYTSQKNNKSWGLNAKYRLPVQFVEGLGIAFGGNYTKMTDASASSFKAYGVASYNVKTDVIAPQVSVGVNWQTINPDEGDKQNGMHVFAALAIGFLEQFAVAAEFENKNSDLDGDSLLTMAGRFMPKQLPGLTLQAGLTTEHGPKQRFFAGAQYAVNFAGK